VCHVRSVSGGFNTSGLHSDKLSVLFKWPVANCVGEPFSSIHNTTHPSVAMVCIPFYKGKVFPLRQVRLLRTGHRQTERQIRLLDEWASHPHHRGRGQQSHVCVQPPQRENKNHISKPAGLISA